MLRAPTPVLTALLLAVTAGAAPATAQTGAPAEVASSTLQGTVLMVSPESSYVSATLRVAGPDGYEAITWSAGGELRVDLIASRVDSEPADGALAVPALPDGRYDYEAIFHRADGSRRRTDGTFFIENGAARWTHSETEAGRPAPPAAERPGFDGPRFDEEEREPEPLAGSEDDQFSVVDTEGDDEVILTLQVTSLPFGEGHQWHVENDHGTLAFEDFEKGGGPVRVAVKPNGRMGIGTTVPQADLHIYRPTGNLRLADSDPCPNPNSGWEIEEDAGFLKFEVIDNCPGDDTGGKVWLEGSTGNVGLGSSSPERDLHVASGAPGLRLEATPSGQKWDLEATSTHFAMVNATTSHFPFLIRASAPTMWLTDGGVGIGVLTPEAMLHVAGSGRIDGDVSLGSSRELKTAFGAVSPDEVLDRVGELPVASWRYKTEDEETRHIGPFAEDFHELFGLGDGETISIVDAQGVTLAAIQALKQDLEEKESRIAELQAANAELLAANAELDARLRAIEERLERAR